jgi:uncharacterized delta-60 repeat protein
MLKNLLLFGLSLLTAPLLPQLAAAQALDPSFTSPVRLYAPGTVYSMAAQQTDGKRVVAGSFSRVNNTDGGTLVRLDAAGRLDAAFAQNVGVARNTFRVKALPSGQYLVSGFFNDAVTAGGITRTALLRLNANGTADATFNAGSGAGSASSGVQINTFVGQPDGKVLVGGTFLSFSGQNTGGLVRLTTTGALDVTFNANLGTGFTGTVNTVAVQPNGKIVVGGTFTAFNGQPVSSLLRLNADGTRDVTFTSSLYPNSYVGALLVQPDGKILATGNLGFGSVNASIVRLTATGSADTGFLTPTYAISYAGSYFDTNVQLQPDGKILFSGAFMGSAAYVIRLNPNGSADNSYHLPNGPSEYPYAIGLQNDGSLWVGGNFSSFNGREAALGRLLSTGETDATFLPRMQAPGRVATVVRQGDGQLIIGGDFTEYNGVALHHVARLSATGIPDAAFAAATDVIAGQVTALVLQPDGKLLVGATSGLRRLLATGSTDGSYDPFAATTNINALAVQPDGKVVAHGYFNNVPGSNSTQYLVRLTTGGGYDSSFSPGTTNALGAISYLTALAVQPDGKVLVGGSFLPPTGSSVLHLVRYESTGAVDASFSTSTTFEFPANPAGAIARFNALAVQPDGKVLVGGYFATAGGTARTNLARLTDAGQLDASFTPPSTLTGAVTTLALQPNGRVLVGSGYGNDGSATTTPLLRLLDTGASDPSFGATAAPNNTITALLAQPNEAIVVGGSFTTIGGQPAVGVARIIAPSPLVGPTVTISSSAGSSTSFAPIPVSVVFSSAVTDFDATDVAIGGNTGTLIANSFRGSGTSYTFSIQPQDVPLVNVALSIAAGAVHDAAGSANPAATFSIQYVRPTATTRQGNNNDWFNPTSWDNGVPTRNIDAVVPDGLVAYVGSGNAQARSLLVGAGANVLQVGGTMELTGNLVSQGSNTSGTYLQELRLTGSSNQTITNGQSLNLSKLTVGSAGATLQGPVTIRTLLTLRGDLTTNNQPLRLVTNYAASGANPALVDNAGGVVQGLAIVERAITGSNQGRGYRHYAPPVTGATVATLATATFTPEVSQASVYNTSASPGTTVPFPTVYAYDESRLASVTNTYSAFDKGFIVPSGLNAPLVPGQGYAVNIAGTEVVNFVGILNNGDYPVALTRVAGNADAGWALVGNPYPAVLDWDLTTRAGLNDALYVVQSTGQYTGGYSGYVNGVAVNNGSQFVAPGQGFFVRVADGQTNGSITFTNAARTVTATPTNFQRLTQETRPLVRLALTGAGLTDETVVYAETGATPAFDPTFDAAKLANPTGLNLSILSAGASLAIDGRAAFTTSTTLPLGVGVPAAGTYTLAAVALDNLPAGLTAYLRDAQTGQSTKLTTGTNYDFRVSATEAQALVLGRFTLGFNPQTALATTPFLSAGAVSVYPNPAHGGFAVTMPGITGANAVQAELINTLGQVVRHQSAALPASGTNFSISTTELATGVYVLRLQAGNTTLTKRVVVQ